MFDILCEILTAPFVFHRNIDIHKKYNEKCLMSKGFSFNLVLLLICIYVLLNHPPAPPDVPPEKVNIFNDCFLLYDKILVGSPKISVN